jgi:hypothetical protein
MPISIRIKRGIGEPTSLLRGELAFDETGQKLYIGKGDSGSDDANGLPIADEIVELTTPPTVLADLADISVGSGASDGDVLVYDSANDEWVAEALSIAWDDVTGKPATFTPGTHASSHHTGGGDAIAPADIGAAAATHSHAWGDITSGVPSSFTPSAHKASHATGGTDALSPADIGAAASSHTHPASDITSGLATVATTGAYSDLSGTPSLATVATTGAYSDLSGKPTLGTAAAAATTDFVAASAISSFGENLLSEESAESARTTLGLGSAATSATSAFAAATHSHAWADITSGVPSSFTPSAHNHTVTLEISGFIESPEAKTYILSPAIPSAITIVNVKAKTSEGTVDIKLQDDGVDITNTTIGEVGTSVAAPGTAPSASVAADSVLALVVSDLQTAPKNLAFTIHYTVTTANNS